MFNIGERDEQGRQKRIEHRGRFLRASRTGGVSLRAQTKAAGLNVTGNTRHGIRVSTRLGKGTNLALQNGNIRLRGRYGKGPAKLNLSKSGMSVSTKNKLGTFNWTNPNRSSAKVFGVQMRGKKAANLQMIYLAFALVAGLVKFAAVLVVGIFQLLAVLIRFSAEAAARSGQATVDLARGIRARRLGHRGRRRLSEGGFDPSARSADGLREDLRYVVAVWGRGLSAEDDAAPVPAGAGVTPGHAGEAARLDELIEPGRPGEEARQMLAILAALATQYRAAADLEEIGETLFLLDETAREVGPRTRLQDRMIDLYVDCSKPTFEVRE